MLACSPNRDAQSIMLNQAAGDEDRARAALGISQVSGSFPGASMEFHGTSMGLTYDFDRASQFS